ncbi:hypothetical protein [Pseudonocardia xishanensis]|uniref:Uncharacterized protein n=1 Tax=Pseudonocardia xishanensis TaxID=630995 RepID=A0ABP8RWH8_9PSEU
MTGVGRALGALVLGSLLVLAGCTGSPPPGGTPATSPATSTAPPPSTVPPAATPTTTPTFRFQALWPFADEAEAARWQSAYREGGHQPWHLDPGDTALGFAGALGLTGIDRVTSTEAGADEAWIGVGFALPDGRPTTAAVVHLARLGTGTDAPWEAVGTRDTDLTLDIPAYGVRVSAPFTVGGQITGVDESLRVQVRAAGTAALLGQACCLPAGGERRRWSTTVGASGRGTATVVVSTGGHVADVERFAVTAVLLG